jgi:hypothetical protein
VPNDISVLFQPPKSNLVEYPTVKETDGERENSYLGLNMTVKPHHFSHGHLKIRCSASIHDIYYQSTEKSVEEERPRGLLQGTATVVGGVPYIPPPSQATDLPPSGHRFDPDTVIGKGNFLYIRCFYTFRLFSATYHSYRASCYDYSRYTALFRINHLNLLWIILRM